jgi:hypothetical protein
MIRKILLSTMLSILVGLSSNIWVVITDAGTFKPIVIFNNGSNIIIDIKGSCKVKKEGWNKYIPATFGTTVKTGDLLMLETKESEAVVICSDLTPYNPKYSPPTPDNLKNIDCRNKIPLIVDREGNYNTPPRYMGEWIILTSPSKTNLLTLNPIMRWIYIVNKDMSTPRGIAYKVKLKGKFNNTKKKELEFNIGQDTQYHIKNDLLMRGESYKLIVEATVDKKPYNSRDEEPEAFLGFTVLNKDEAERVRNNEKAILKLQLSESSRKYLVAKYYASEKLLAESIEQLEELSNKFKKPAVLRTLGELYLSIGWIHKSSEYLNKAYEESNKEGDLEGKALAKELLGFTFLLRAETGQAIKKWEEAEKLFKDFEADTDANRVRELIKKASSSSHKTK